MDKGQQTVSKGEFRDISSFVTILKRRICGDAEIRG
jgi:hypothetical protein